MIIKTKYLEFGDLVGNTSTLYYIKGVNNRDFEKVQIILEKCSPTEVLLTNPNFPFYEVYIKGDDKTFNRKIVYHIKKLKKELEK